LAGGNKGDTTIKPQGHVGKVVLTLLLKAQVKENGGELFGTVGQTTKEKRK